MQKISHGAPDVEHRSRTPKETLEARKPLFGCEHMRGGVRLIFRFTIVDELPTIERRSETRLKPWTHVNQPAIRAPHVAKPVIDGLVQALPPEHGAGRPAQVARDLFEMMCVDLLGLHGVLPA